MHQLGVGDEDDGPRWAAVEGVEGSYGVAEEHFEAVLGLRKAGFVGGDGQRERGEREGEKLEHGVRGDVVVAVECVDVSVLWRIWAVV